VSKTDLEWQLLPRSVARADSPKFQFQLSVFFSSTHLEYALEIATRAFLSFAEVEEYALETECHRQIVRIGRDRIVLSKATLVDYAGEQDKRALFDEGSQVCEKRFTNVWILENSEVAVASSDITLVQDNLVVTEVAEFELRHRRNNRLRVVRLPEQAECQHKDGVVRID